MRTETLQRGTRFSVILLVCAAALLSAFGQAASASALTVRVLDVGQGDSIFVVFPEGGTMLVDAGTAEAGPRVVETLRSLDAEKIDILVATHPHSDHIGGMLAVLDAFPVGKVWDSGYVHGTRTQQLFLQVVLDRKIRFGRPKAGFSEEFQGVLIEVLAPVKLIYGTDADVNNNSIVLRLSFGEVSFLLAADMETEQRRTVRRFPETTVLKVAHHGSHNGTDARFLAMLRPKTAIISCGKENPYGHPHREAVALLEEAGVDLFTTIGGDVVVQTDGIEFTVRKVLESEKSGQEKERFYIGNRSSRVFHTSACDGLPSERNRVYFKSAEEAVKAGYRPCGRCVQ